MIPVIFFRDPQLFVALNFRRFFKTHTLTHTRNRYQKVINCPPEPRRFIFVYGDAIFALPEAFFFGYSGTIFERPRSLSIDYSGAKYVRSALKIAAAQKALF